MAPYNRHQFEALSKLCSVELLASVPWFPGDAFIARLRGRPWQKIPDVVQIGTLEVTYSRVFYLPWVGQFMSGFTYASSLWPKIGSKRGKIDVVLAAFAYPDGFAGALLARALGVPLVVKVHGSDINVLPGKSGLGALIRWTMRQAHSVFGPSRPLIERAVELGANPERARVVLNGIDKQTFRVRDRSEARLGLGLSCDARLLLFVGRPERTKGFDEVITAMASLRDSTPPVELIVVGDGPETAAYRERAGQLGVNVKFVGVMSQQGVANYLAACDALVLPSWAEGTPNVIIEALASGRRVVATAVGGIPDIVNQPELGVLVEPRNADALAHALRRVLTEPYDPVYVSQNMGFGDWSHSAGEVLQILESAMAHGKSASRGDT
jgi:glycosyltransferase involved in cell wall biosynthesis